VRKARTAVKSLGNKKDSDAQTVLVYASVEGDYRKCLRIIPKKRNVMLSIPNEIYMPLFDIGVHQPDTDLVTDIHTTGIINEFSFHRQTQ
jgi:hypothetical protein